MAERVIFEYRAENDEGVCGFKFKHEGQAFKIFDPSIWSWCQPPGGPKRSPAGGPEWRRRTRDASREQMRETLDFLERVYRDLYGREDV